MFEVIQMTFLERLNLLKQRTGDNNSTLAKRSGVPYTTIDGLYKKGYNNTKLSTLESLCRYFNVTLDYLVYGVEETKADYTSAGIAARGKSAEWRAMMENIEHSRALDALDALYDEDERAVIEEYHQMTKAQKRRFKRLLEIIKEDENE